MKSFKIKFPLSVWILLAAVSVIFAVSTALNIFDATAYSTENPVRFSFAIILAVISAALLTLSVAALVGARYSVKGNYLYFYFGFIFTKTDINAIFQLTEFKAQNKLVIYYSGEKYAVVLIDKKRFSGFYEALKKVNPDIIYTVQEIEEK